MNPDEQYEYAHIITSSFKQNEIEHLEEFAEYGFERIEKTEGGHWEFDPDAPLLLDQLKEYEEGGTE